MVDITKLVRFLFVDGKDDGGNLPWDDTTALHIERGAKTGTYEHAGKAGTFSRASVAPAPVPAPTPVPTPPAPTPAPPVKTPPVVTPPPPPAPPVTTANPTLTVVPIPDRQPFPWDAPFTGTLDGWDAAKFNTGSGYASFTVKLTKDAPGIWLRPHSATGPAADPKTAGTGAVLRQPIQVSGPVKAGTVQVKAQFPHGFEWFLADFDTDPGMAQAVRLPSRFGISFHGSGAGTSHAFRYMNDGYATDAAHPAPNPPDFMTLNPFGVVNGADQNQGDANWHLPGEPNSGCNSFHAARLLDDLCKGTGGIVSFAPFALNGGNTGNYQVNDLARTYGSLQRALKRGLRTHWFIPLFGPNDKGQLSADQTCSLLLRLFQAVQRDGNNPDVLFSICASPLWDGGQQGFLEGHLANELAEKASIGRVVFMRSFDAGGHWGQNGHATQWGRTRYAAMQAQGVLALFDKLRGLPPRSTGARILSATRDGKLIRVKVSAPVHVEAWSEGATAPAMLTLDQSKTPVPPEALASIPDVFPAGNADTTRLPVASVAIANDAPGGPELQITLVTDPGDQAKPLELWWGMVLNDKSSFSKIQPGQWMAAVKDASGVDLQRSIHAVPVIPAQAGPATLALDTPPDLIAGARARIGGTGSGQPVSTVQVAVNGATVTPDELLVMADNTWSGIVQVPATPGQATLALPNGPAVTVNVCAPRDRLPASYRDKVLGYYRADSGVFADRAATTPTAKMGSVLRWKDLTGGVGDLVGFTDDPDAAPLLDPNRRSWGAGGYRFRDPRSFRSSLAFEMVSSPSGSGRHLGVRNAAMAAALAGDLTLVFVADGNPAGIFAGWFQLGNTTDAWGFDTTNQPGFTGSGSGVPNVSYGKSQLTLPKAPGYGNSLVVRYNATSRLLRFRSHEGEASFTAPASVTAPINSFRLGSAALPGTVRGSWMALSEVQIIGAELTDDQVNTDLANYTKAEWLV